MVPQNANCFRQRDDLMPVRFSWPQTDATALRNLGRKRGGTFWADRRTLSAQNLIARLSRRRLLDAKGERHGFVYGSNRTIFS